MRRAVRPVVALSAALAATAPGALAAERADAAPFRLERVAGGLPGALGAVPQPGSPGRLAVPLQGGRVRMLVEGNLAGAPLLDLSGRVSDGREQGLLGLAFHPDHAENGLLYVNFTDRAGDTRVVEYRTDPGGARVDPASERELLRIAQPFANHNGGHLVFDGDGRLLIGTGDGGGGGDPAGNAQRLDTLLGKILRIDVDAREGGRPYGIPAGNPFAGRAGARPEILVRGLRNPWRFSFDRARGDLWIADVGQNDIEEVTMLPAGRIAGANLGWSAFEGPRPYDGPGALRGGPHVPPSAWYTHARGCSVTGGFVYRGDALPRMRGRYVYGDFCSGRVWTMRAGPDPGGVREETPGLGRRPEGLTSFGEGPGGELHAVAGGVVYRLAPPRPRFTLSASQLLINQRIAQAAVRRAAAVARWLDEGVAPGDLRAGSVEARDLHPSVGTSGAGAEARPGDADPRPVRVAPRRGDGGPVRLTAAQLLVNQRIAQAAIRRAGALSDRLGRGLTGGDLRPGAVTAGSLAPGLGITGTAPVPEPPPSRTRVTPRRGGDPGAVRLSVAQLRVNQRVAQAAVRRSNRLLGLLSEGLTGAQVRDGSLTAADLAEDLR